MNQSLFNALHQFAGRYALLDLVGVFFAQYLPYLLVAGFLVLLIREKGWRMRWYLAIEAAVTVIVSRGILVEVIRFFYHHPRPFDVYGFTPLIGESGYSFPSGHAAWFFALALVVWYTNRKWGMWYFVFALVMGVARIYVGVHWPYDIAGGAALGLIVAFIVHALFKKTRDAITASRNTISTPAAS